VSLTHSSSVLKLGDPQQPTNITRPQLHTALCILQSANRILHSAYCTPHTAHHKVHSAHCILHTHLRWPSMWLERAASLSVCPPAAFFASSTELMWRSTSVVCAAISRGPALKLQGFCRLTSCCRMAPYDRWAGGSSSRDNAVDACRWQPTMSHMQAHGGMAQVHQPPLPARAGFTGCTLTPCSNTQASATACIRLLSWIPLFLGWAYTTQNPPGPVP
jgi:hypothetical protein